MFIPPPSEDPVEFSLHSGEIPEIRINGISLLSRKDPQKEARRYCEGLLSSWDIVPCKIAILGCGWGLHLEALLTHEAFQCNERRLICYEPLLSLKSHLQVRGRLERLKEAGAQILFSKEEFLRELEKEEILTISIHPSYARWIQQKWPAADTSTHAYTSDNALKTDRATVQRFLHEWYRNHFIRLAQKEAKLHYAGGNGTDLAHGYPAIYCGAGPGLMDDLEDFSAMNPGWEKETLMIASDTSLGPLLAKGFTPDYVISIDSGRGTLFHMAAALPFARLPLASTLVTFSGGRHDLDQFFQSTLYYRSTFPPDQLQGEGPLRQAPEWKNPSRNPAGIALHLARWRGAACLWLAGATFQSWGSVSHVTGSGYTLYAQLGQSRLTPVHGYLVKGYGNAERTSTKASVASLGLESLARELNMTLLRVGGNRSEKHSSIADLPPQDKNVMVALSDSMRFFFQSSTDNEAMVNELFSGIRPDRYRRWRKMLERRNLENKSP